MFQIIWNKELQRGAGKVVRKLLVPLLKENKKVIHQKLVNGTAIKNNTGDRMWPSDKKDDPAVGIRFDWGIVTEQSGQRYKSVDIAINSNAANSTLAAMAAGSKSHKKRVTILVPVDSQNQPAFEEDQFDKFFTELSDDLAEGGL